MMRNWLKSLLFISAFSPTLLSLAGVRYYSKGLEPIFYQLIIISLIGITMPFFILFLINKNSEKIKFRAKKVESADYVLLVFIGSYIAPVIMKVAEINFNMIVLIVAILFMVAWIVSYIPTHPILYLGKFKFYKVESENGMVYTLMSRRIIRSPQSIKEVRQISNSMLME